MEGCYCEHRDEWQRHHFHHGATRGESRLRSCRWGFGGRRADWRRMPNSNVQFLLLYLRQRTSRDKADQRRHYLHRHAPKLTYPASHVDSARVALKIIFGSYYCAPCSNQSRNVADMLIFSFIGAGFRTTSLYQARSYACGGRSGGAVNCHDLPKPEQCKMAGEPNVPIRRNG